MILPIYKNLYIPLRSDITLLFTMTALGLRKLYIPLRSDITKNQSELKFALITTLYPTTFRYNLIQVVDHARFRFSLYPTTFRYNPSRFIAKSNGSGAIFISHYVQI